MKNITEVLKSFENAIIKQQGIIDFAWCTTLLYPFYTEFDNANDKVASQSLLAFWGLLIEWEDQSGFPFYTGKEKYECHHFDKYMFKFMELTKVLETKYPNIFSLIIIALQKLDIRDGIRSEFPNLNKQFHDSVSKFIYEYDYDIYDDIYDEALKEAYVSI